MCGDRARMAEDVQESLRQEGKELARVVKARCNGVLCWALMLQEQKSDGKGPL